MESSPAGATTSTSEQREAALPSCLLALEEALREAREDWARRARRFRTRYRRSYQTLFLLTPLAIGCTIGPKLLDRAGSAWKPDASMWKLAEMALLAILFAALMLLKRSQWKERWLSCRLVAEQIRYLPLIAPLVRDAAENWYLEVARRAHTRYEPQPAVTQACREAAALKSSLPGLADAVFRADYVRAVQRLVRNQLDYHLWRATHEARLERLSTWIGGALLLIALAASVLESYWPVPGLLAAVLIVVAGVAPAVVTSGNALLTHRESARLAFSSGQMQARLRASLEELHPDVGIEALERSVLQFVVAALMESENWYALQKTSKLRLT